jgi:hypothetical protein
MKAHKRTDFKVYKETTRMGGTSWRVRSGGPTGDVTTNCKSLEAAEKLADQLNLDPWFLDRGNTRADRAKNG